MTTNLALSVILAAFCSTQPTATPAPAHATQSAPVAEPATAVPAEPKPTKPLPEGSKLYHTLTGRDAQVIFTSDAPLEKIIGKSNAVVGFAVPGPKGGLVFVRSAAKGA